MRTQDEQLPQSLPDEQEFERRLTGHVPRLTLFVQRCGRGVLDGDCGAEDLVQATLARAWQLRATPRSPEPGAEYRWLVAIARNIVCERAKYRRGKGRNRIRHVESSSRHGDGPAMAAVQTSVGSRAAHRESIERLAGAIRCLARPDRRLIELCFLEGLSIAEAAARVGTSKATAWAGLGRAVATLRRMLRDLGADEA